MTSTFASRMTRTLHSIPFSSPAYQHTVRTEPPRGDLAYWPLTYGFRVTIVLLIVWAILWILFEIGVLIGFILIGIAAFKETPSEMATRAGECRYLRIILALEASVYSWLLYLQLPSFQRDQSRPCRQRPFAALLDPCMHAVSRIHALSFAPGFIRSLFCYRISHIHPAPA